MAHTECTTLKMPENILVLECFYRIRNDSCNLQRREGKLKLLDGKWKVGACRIQVVNDMLVNDKK